MQFYIEEYAHDTPGKIVSYALRINEGATGYTAQLEVPELIRLHSLLTRTIAADRSRFSSRFVEQ